MLLIVTSKRDLAADYLIVRLIERQKPYFRINSEELAGAQVTFRMEGGSSYREATLNDARSIDLADVTAVWYRRAIDPLPSHALSEAQKRFVAGELRQLWAGLILDPTVRWVNPIDDVFVGEHKVYQLRIASQIGFQVPESLISNSADKLSDFVGRYSSVICKPIFHGLYAEGDRRFSIYTRRVTSDELTDQGTVDLCPVFLQAEVPRAADWRVTFIGHECFAVRITSNDPRLVDWRVPDAILDHRVVEMPAIERDRCVRFMRSFGLCYAAFDFIETPSGELVFLEVNPTGEWAWLEDRLGLPMRDAFIRLFYGEEA